MSGSNASKTDPVVETESVSAVNPTERSWRMPASPYPSPGNQRHRTRSR